MCILERLYLEDYALVRNIGKTKKSLECWVAKLTIA